MLNTAGLTGINRPLCYTVLWDDFWPAEDENERVSLESPESVECNQRIVRSSARYLEFDPSNASFTTVTVRS